MLFWIVVGVLAIAVAACLIVVGLMIRDTQEFD
jgi:hypothetical protein